MTTEELPNLGYHVENVTDDLTVFGESEGHFLRTLDTAVGMWYTHNYPESMVSPCFREEEQSFQMFGTVLAYALRRYQGRNRIEDANPIPVPFCQRITSTKHWMATDTKIIFREVSLSVEFFHELATWEHTPPAAARVRWVINTLATSIK